GENSCGGRQECPLPPNSAITAERHPIPHLPQGACLAEEVGEVGGETCGSARERAGFAPDKSLCPRSGPHPPSGGSGAAAPESAFSLSETKPADELTSPLLPAKPSVLSI